MTFTFGPRRGVYTDISQEMKVPPLDADELKHFEIFDLIYRSLCAMLYNYVPTSGHPGGSISSGRFVEGILFDSMDYDLSDPDREDADIISYAAGHKALGLYAMWALRNEVARIGAPELLAKDERCQLRLEDLLGFRRNPISATPLFKKYRAKPLDGHPTPATPFVRLATGASGVGVTASIGLALGALDYYGADAPWVHIVEGEGGMTPGRVAEGFAAAGTTGISNVIIHIDWNQASIDSNRVCRDGMMPGDYVQWTPAEFAYLHDWNVIAVPDGSDFQQIVAAQRKALSIGNGQPTAIVYRTVKGWQYGIEGRISHGAGHKLCSEGFYKAVTPLLSITGGSLPVCESAAQGVVRGRNLHPLTLASDWLCQRERMEACFFEALGVVRQVMEKESGMVSALAKRLLAARERLDGRKRGKGKNAPRLQAVYERASSAGKEEVPPDEVAVSKGTVTTVRGELGRVLNYYNKLSGGALLVAAADLLGSTSVSEIAKGFAEGYYHGRDNRGARLLSAGGICEDAMAGILTGLSAFGHHIGVGSSYGAFIAPLGHIAARLHAIGSQAREALKKEPYKPAILVCAHAGLKTGEDGPTHADPQALQLLQENFPLGTMITLTPWEPQEVWPLVSVSLARRPAIIAPFVTRPGETVPDRGALGLAPARDAVKGVYLLRKAKGKGDGTVVLQESGVAFAFVEQALPLLLRDGIDLNVYYVASAELFDLLPKEEQERIFPTLLAQEAMGITGFTLPTMHRWIRSDRGIRATLHPFMKGHYLGSGQAAMVLAEAGLDGESQYKAVLRYIKV